ncbi:MAG: alcohol dehydrogenase [Chloroflexi bacterium]|nr:alcohol dehydrogenase [Chloroflexota bacterium]
MSASEKNYRLDTPTAILTGGGCRKLIGSIVNELDAKRVLLVTDPGVIELGVAGEITGLLESAGCVVKVFHEVQPDPTDENVSNGVNALNEHQAELVVAVGGGSPIDAAKVIAIRPRNNEPLPNFLGLHKIQNPGLPLVAVPTTAGTGSEATKAAVITNTADNVKMMMLSVPLLPRVALVDYELSMSMPQTLTAAVGVDTLTHGIEAYVSKKNNGMSDPLALSCIDLVGKFLKQAWNNPDDLEARKGMMLAATQGGMAFSNSSVCLVHGMSRPIGAVFHLPHGLSNAILLPTITEFSWPSDPERYAVVARTLGCADKNTEDSAACKALIDYLKKLNSDLELPRLSECQGVTREVFDEQVQKMASDSIASGSPANNPRVPSAEQIIDLYDKAW